LIQATLARLASEHEVSLIQVRLLGILRDREPGIVELADVLNLDKSSVSGLVDRAQRRGLVERASAKSSDGRAIRVLLTSAGEGAGGLNGQNSKDRLMSGFNCSQHTR
jgi:MarR family transcriptional regulator, lower aerobic nicotinate degradation pathway regulator